MLVLVKMQLKKKAQSSGNAKAASLAQLDEYSSEDSRPVWAPSTTTQLDNYKDKHLLSTPDVCKHRFNLFWWRKMQVDGEQVSCGLSFVLFAWNENTCNHRCKSKSRIFYASFLHLCQSYHFLIPSSVMSLWHNNVKHVPCILCCIHLSHKQLRKDWGGWGV